MTLQTKMLDDRHPFYTENCEAWDDIDLLYRGGHALKKQASRFLLKRPKELTEVYNARLHRFTYQNILGTALGWYQTALFENDPDILIRRGDAELDGDGRDFYSRFLADSDRHGTSFPALFREVFLNTVLFRSAFVLTDLPRVGPASTLAEQKALGALDPYLVVYDPRQVINWETDGYGNLAWVVIATTEERRGFAQETAVVDRWYYFDRAEYRVYEAARRERGKKAEAAALIDQGPHALAQVGRVPVRWIQIPDALWLADRVYLQVLDHLNQDNTFGWALFMANLPVPYVKGDFDQDPKIAETSYLQLAENGEFGWAEPAGTSFEHSASRISALREEIYRQMYLQAQGRSSEATPAAQSGFSKQMDMAPSRDVLRGYGDILRGSMRGVLRDVADARGDEDIVFDIRGFDFSDDDTNDELKTAQTAQGLQIPSDTLEKEVHKRVARCLMKDARPEIIRQIEAEIESAPTREERVKAEAEAQRESIRQSLRGMTKTSL